MITKRTKKIVKQTTFYSRYAIELYIDNKLQIRLHRTKDVVSYVMTSDEKMDGKIEKIEWGREILRKVYKYSKDPVDEWKQFCKHVLDIFKKQTIDYLSMTMDAFPGQNISIIDFLRKNVKSVDKCSLDQRDKEINVEKHTAYLLDNIKIDSELSFDVYIHNEGFNGKIPKDLKELNIHNSQWFGFERLLEIDCKSLSLEYDWISNEQLNSFFKKWIAMETNQNMEYLELVNRKLDRFRDRVLHDIPHEVVDEGVERVMKT
ncbi:hypothetical protein CRE_21676 [Caenorhabditis remanei]|uniref:Sdz-33 F-box domain-containing protein n=1 Tax=Caenorhabditis remanei TaxID=31234 RepID=E3NSL8_CAERE|nr:hypothetical protein CRE_21676 [Caenorhabditis remanei]